MQEIKELSQALEHVYYLDKEAPVMERSIDARKQSREFWSTYVSADNPICPRCQCEKFEKRELTEHVANNGDGWGLLYKICTRCGWHTYWVWSDK